MSENYIQVLMESLKKKDIVLNQILEKSREQAEIIAGSELNEEAFQKNVEEKDVLIKEITRLDDGFTLLYERVSLELTENRSKYSKEIAAMQELIRTVSEKTMLIQEQEKQNKQNIEKYFADNRMKVRTVKKSKTVASNYYKSMAKLNLAEAQFMDKKK